MNETNVNLCPHRNCILVEVGWRTNNKQIFLKYGILKVISALKKNKAEKATRVCQAVNMQ